MIRVEKGLVAIEPGVPLHVESTVPIYPEEPRGIAIVEVDEGIEERSVRRLYERVVSEYGLNGYHVLYTAARLPSHAAIEHGVVGDINVVVVVTVGHKPVACTRWGSRPYQPLVGTINVVVYTTAPLRREALLDLMRVAIEAKTVAVNEALPWCTRRPLGTLTDAIAVARPAGLPGIYSTSGVATRIGSLVADAVESLVLRLWRSTITGEEQLRITLGPYARPEVLEAAARDANIRALLLAARHLDLHREYGSLPEKLATPHALLEALRSLRHGRSTHRSHLEVLVEALGVARVHRDGGG